MRNRKVLRFEQPGSATRSALTEPRLATTCLSWLEDKSPAAPYDAVTGPGEIQRAIAHLPKGFDNLCCKLERLCDGQSAQPVRRRPLAVNWGEPGELPLEIHVKIRSIS